MNLTKQRQLIARIQADLRKEAARHDRDECPLAAAEANDEADALAFVNDSLRLLQKIRGVVTALYEGISDS